MKRMTVKYATACVGQMAVLKFFPSDELARASLIRMLMEMCRCQEEAAWLVNRMTDGSLYNEWPGPYELRAVFCSRFSPLDGKNVVGTAAYPDGIPSEHSSRSMIETRQYPELPSDDPDMNALVTTTAGKLRRM